VAVTTMSRHVQTTERSGNHCSAPEPGRMPVAATLAVTARSGKGGWERQRPCSTCSRW
jgi:hypothetical protein